jgi:hypothetical protein
MQKGMLPRGLEDEDDHEVQKLDMEIAKKELQVLTKQRALQLRQGRVAMRTIADGRMDGRTMAAGSSMTWMHNSVRYEVT